MNSEERLEMLMQRAIDRELSSPQRRELLDALNDHPDGWKQLSCAFLEEQLVGSGVRGAATMAASMDEPAATVTPASRQSAFWYQHPVLSTAVTICLAFVLGLAIPVEQTNQQPVAGAQTVHGGQPVSVGTGSARMDRDEELRLEMQALRRLLESFNTPRR